MSNTIPTVRLRETDRGLLLRHFIALGTEDRRLRFGAPVPDESVEAYAARIDFEQDGAFAVHDEQLALVAVVHVAISGFAAELGLSVLPGWRGKGLGDSLLKRAVTFLRNRGVTVVHVHCLAENGAMVHLARRNGMRVVYAGSESDARLELEPATADSFVSEWIDDQRGQAQHAFSRDASLARSLGPPASEGLKP